MTSVAANPSSLERPSTHPATLSPRAVVLVLVLSLGVFALRSAWRLFQVGGELSGFRIQMANRSLAFVVLYEVVIGLLLILFLKHRGWRLEHVTRPFVRRDVARGLGVWALTVLSIWIVFLGLHFLNPGYLGEVMKTRIIGEPSAWLIAAVVLINPAYEELVYLGFVPAAFAKSAPWQILILSTALRVVVHTYQGVLSLLVILPWGLVFTAYYLRTRRLWPLILAHALQDAIALLALEG
jgi:uncharacterized protein